MDDKNKDALIDLLLMLGIGSILLYSIKMILDYWYMPSYSADQIIGKTLYAKKPTPVYNLPSFYPNAQKKIVIKPGQIIGTVYSYVGGQPGQPLNWMYKGKVGLNEVTYYTEHEPDNVDKGLLQDQGVKTTKEIQEEKEEANKSTGDKLIDTLKSVLKYAGIGIGLYLIFKTVYKGKNEWYKKNSIFYIRCFNSL